MRVGCTFVPVSQNECPSNPDLPECTPFMSIDELCEADATLPDGNQNYDVNNCDGATSAFDNDVFKCVKGTLLE